MENENVKGITITWRYKQLSHNLFSFDEQKVLHTVCQKSSDKTTQPQAVLS